MYAQKLDLKDDTEVGKGYVCSEHIPVTNGTGYLASYPGSSPAEGRGGEEPGYEANRIHMDKLWSMLTNQLVLTFHHRVTASFMLASSTSANAPDLLF